jgi:hypothetical protein
LGRPGRGSVALGQEADEKPREASIEGSLDVSEKRMKESNDTRASESVSLPPKVKESSALS